MTTVCDDGYFHLIIVRRLHNIPQPLGKQNRLATDDIQSDFENSLAAKVLANVRKYFLYVVRIAPDFGGLVPFGKTEFAMVIACFGDMPVDDDEFLDIHKSSQVCGEWLGDDDTGLDEISADVVVVIASHHFVGVVVAGRTRYDERLEAALRHMPERRVRFTWNEFPTLAPDECVAEIVDSLVG